MVSREASSKVGSKASRKASSVAVSQLAFSRHCLDRPIHAFITHIKLLQWTLKE